MPCAQYMPFDQRGMAGRAMRLGLVGAFVQSMPFLIHTVI